MWKISKEIIILLEFLTSKKTQCSEMSIFLLLVKTQKLLCSSHQSSLKIMKVIWGGCVARNLYFSHEKLYSCFVSLKTSVKFRNLRIQTEFFLVLSKFCAYFWDLFVEITGLVVICFFLYKHFCTIKKSHWPGTKIPKCVGINK